MTPLPLSITSEAELEERLSRPSPAVVRAMGELDGDLVILGVGGKMGPSLARMARRALDEAGKPRARVIGVARFSEPGLRERLQSEGVETVACDLLDADQRRRLPHAANVLSTLGHKFSAGDPPGKHWAVNVQIVGALAEQYRASRWVAFSSGNVYPLVAADGPQPTEETPPGPVGEYAMTAWGRERVIEHASAHFGMPACLLRLNYAVDLRYGVPVDIAKKLLAGEAIDLSMPAVNFVWQGYANEVALRAFALATSPATILNLTGAERLRTRDLAERLARRLGVTPRFVENEGSRALLNDASRCHRLFGPPEFDAEQLLDAVAGWMQSGGRCLNRPTRFQVTDGRF